MRASPSVRFHGRIARQLGIDILAGRFAPGALLPGEIEFSEQLNVSRSVYREAIRFLVAKGLVESRPKLGTRVTDRQQWNLLDPDILAWMFEAEPAREFIRDLFELRMILEPAAAELAARRRSSDELSRMGHALEEMARLGLGVPEGRRADEAFHRTIMLATRNAPLMSLTSSVEAAVGWTTTYKQRKRTLPRDPLPEHRQLYRTIADADPQGARAAMVELISLALQDTEMSLQD